MGGIKPTAFQSPAHAGYFKNIFFMLNHKTKISVNLYMAYTPTKAQRITMHKHSMYEVRDHIKHRKNYIILYRLSFLLFFHALDTIPNSRIVLMLWFPLNTIQAGYSFVFLYDLLQPTNTHRHTISIDGPICTLLDVKPLGQNQRHYSTAFMLKTICPEL